jgi:hypothetical protein
MVIRQLRRADPLLSQELPHSREHYFELSRLRRLREKEAMLRSIRGG